MKNLKCAFNLNKFLKFNFQFYSEFAGRNYLSNAMFNPVSIVNNNFDDVNENFSNNTNEIINETFNPFIINNDKETITKETSDVSVEMKGRNSKAPKRANHGARPCSSVMRRLKARAYYRKSYVK